MCTIHICTYLFICENTQGIDVNTDNGMKKKRNKTQIKSLFRLNIPIPSSLPTENGFFSFHLYFTEWQHHCYNNLVKATLKCILLLHATPTASDTSTIIILFIKCFHISHAALFHYYMYEPWKCDLLSAKYTTDTLCSTSHSVTFFSPHLSGLYCEFIDSC